MDKNDFDIDFDFEKEYGVDPTLYENSDDDDFDYDEFLREDLDEDHFQENSEEKVAAEEPAEEEETEENENLVSDFPTRRTYTEEETVYEDEPQEGEEEAPQDEEVYEETVEEEVPGDEETVEETEPKKLRHTRKKASGLKLPKITLPKVKLPGKKQDAVSEEGDEEKPKNPRRRPPKQKPTLFSKFLDWYMEPVTKLAAKEKEEQILDPLDPKVIRRKKRDKKRIFKEVYLPAIIASVALFLIISFAVGALSNALREAKVKDAEEKQEAQTQVEAANRAEQEFQAMLAEADRLAMGYDYDEALKLVNNFTANSDQFAEELSAKRLELTNAQKDLQEFKDTSTIANLSFHVLIADPNRAFQKATAGDLAGSYNKNFVTCEEFSRILNQLYTGNYVLVDFDSFVSANAGVDDNESFFANSLWLPAGKKPIMITETMVNYFEYMVDSNKDGEPDAGGHGFANRLVVDGSGEIKAAYVDASGNESIGNYDLVPILEDFIKEHPDFSYRGARAILAVTGKEGVFGYRTNTSYVATKGQSYYDEQVYQAKNVVDALRQKGYTLASYTYDNVAYKGMSTVQIQAEMQNWTNQVTPVLGDVNVMVFARASDIEAYSGTSFNVLYNTGFRYFLNSGTSPRVDINTTFVKQTRLMVTGEAMVWYSNQFTNYFDSNMVLDLSSRGNVPRS